MSGQTYAGTPARIGAANGGIVRHARHQAARPRKKRRHPPGIVEMARAAR